MKAEHIFANHDESLRNALMARALEEKRRRIGDGISLRSLIEVSNICVRNCLYCGIRGALRRIKRFEMPKEDFLSCVRFSFDKNIPSFAIQAGERNDARFVEYISDLLRCVRKEADERGIEKVGITLSLGEQSHATYRQWKRLGATRYLLRIESSNPALFEKMHPRKQRFSQRVECLHMLKDLGYQVGSGVMTGVPGQSPEDLARDLDFYESMDFDMIGMGPFIPHPETPMGKGIAVTPEYKRSQLCLALKMIALTRLRMPNINIAAATALQSLSPEGRYLALMAGANVLMPNITPNRFRDNYNLYPGKIAQHEENSMRLALMDEDIARASAVPLYGELGDSMHFLERRAWHGSGEFCRDAAKEKGEEKFRGEPAPGD